MGVYNLMKGTWHESDMQYMKTKKKIERFLYWSRIIVKSSYCDNGYIRSIGIN